MTTTATTDTRAAAPTVGEPRELARYTTATGTERVLGGQRVNGVVSFLPREGVVLVLQQGLSEDDACSSRGIPAEPARPDAARRKRPNGVSRPHLINTGGAS
jgi:hypothetical protein